jgi:hypothetical protein
MTALSVPLIVALAIGAADGSTTTKHLTVTASVSPATAAPGARVSLRLDVTPRPAMHVYAPEQKDYIPISLALEANASVKAHLIQFPKPEKLFVKDLGETQLVYSKPFRIVQDVTVAQRGAVAGRAGAGTAAPPLTIKGLLTYQACDDAICYAPVSVPVAWTLDLTRAAKGTR